jgi:hypothetical protein
MASQDNSFYSSPTFELFRRGLGSRIVTRFHGLNAYTPLNVLGPDWAQDLLNVIVNSDGHLSKFRLPQPLSPPTVFPSGPQQMLDFQRQNGLRQIVASIGNSVGFYSNDGTVGPTLFGVGIYGPGAPQLAGPWSFVEVGNIVLGFNGQVSFKWTGTDSLIIGIEIPLIAPTVIVGAPASGTLNPTFGYEYAYSWKASGASPALAGPSPIEVSTASPNSPQQGAVAPATNISLTVSAGVAVPPDPQIDTIVWWRTLDGGGDLFRLAEVNINTGIVTFNTATVTTSGVAPFLSIKDNTPDAALDQTTRAPFLNALPLTGKYAAVGQGRVFIGNLPGAPQDIIYSGYERILVGNPPETYPPNNRLRLQIGAEAINGLGVLQQGVVGFSNADRIYMLRGQVEDITDTAPVQFTQYLIELPWKMGCLCHQTIQATPYGLVWLAGDRTVQLFDGYQTIQDISGPVYPILRGITKGAEALCSSAYFNWLERDWYALLVPYGGSITPNRAIFWGLNKDTSSIDIFICTIPMDGIATMVTSQNQRQLIMGRVGQLFNLPVSSDTKGGIADLTLVPATAGQLPAYWFGGYNGNDSPQRAEMFRWVRLVTDQAPQSFQIMASLVDDDVHPLTAPVFMGPLQMKSSKLGINQRAKRCAILVDFPVQDVSANVLELQVHSVPSSDR